MRTCKTCLLEFPSTLEFFYAHKNGKLGMLGHCKNCILIKQSAYRKKNHTEVLTKKAAYRASESGQRRIKEWGSIYAQKEDTKLRHRQAQKRAKSKPRGWFDRNWYAIRRRCRIESIAFDLPRPFLFELWERQNGLCAIFREPLTLVVGSGMVMTNPSVDRIDPAKGYTMGNVQIVSLLANMMKTSLKMSEFIQRCQRISELHS